jgi:hypothetical protein
LLLLLLLLVLQVRPLFPQTLLPLLCSCLFVGAATQTLAVLVL